MDNLLLGLPCFCISLGGDRGECIPHCEVLCVAEEEMMTLDEFHCQLAWALIKNPEWMC